MQATAADWRMRPAEACIVTQLEYVISSDGDDHTVAKVGHLVWSVDSKLNDKARLHASDLVRLGLRGCTVCNFALLPLCAR